MLQLTRTTQLDQELKFSHATDTGRPGAQNSDAYLIFPTEIATPWDEQPEATWFVLLANGDQQHSSSRVASQLAVESVYQELIDNERVGHSTPKRLDSALQQAHTNILETSLSEPDLLGMQTSMLAAAINAGHVHFACTGDYGAFLYRNGAVHAIVLDNTSSSMPQDARMPLFTRAETEALQTSARQAMSLRAACGLGHVDGIEIAKKVRLQDIEQRDDPTDGVTQNADAKQLTLLPNDILILCSSRMTKALTPINIRTAIANYPLADVADQLIRVVKEKGVEEDATAVVVRWTGETVTPQETAINLASLNWSTRKSALVLMTVLVAFSLWFAAGTIFDTQPGIASQNQAEVGKLSATNGSTTELETSDIEIPKEEIAPERLASNAVLADASNENIVEPIATESAVTEPAVTEPAVTEPVVTEPVIADPVMTEQDATKGVEIDAKTNEQISAEPVANAGNELNESNAIVRAYSEPATEQSAASSIEPSIEEPIAPSLSPHISTAESYAIDTTPGASESATTVAVDGLLALLQSLPVPANSAGEEPPSEPTSLANGDGSSEPTAPPATTIVDAALDVNVPTVQIIEPAIPAPSVDTETIAADAQVTDSEEAESSVGAVLPLENAEPETAPTASNATIYLLTEGDNLWTIAWDNDLTVEDLLTANPFITSKDQILSIGTALVIPGK